MEDSWNLALEQRKNYRYYVFLQWQTSWVICGILCITERRKKHAFVHVKLIWRIYHCPCREVLVCSSNHTEPASSALPPLHPAPQCCAAALSTGQRCWTHSLRSEFPSPEQLLLWAPIPKSHTLGHSLPRQGVPHRHTHRGHRITIFHLLIPHAPSRE